MQVTVEGSDLVIRVPMNQPPRLSGSGKSMLIASDRTKVTLEGVPTPVNVQVNAHTPAPKTVPA
jgi:hypothetical protein